MQLVESIKQNLVLQTRTVSIQFSSIKKAKKVLTIPYYGFSTFEGNITILYMLQKIRTPEGEYLSSNINVNNVNIFYDTLRLSQFIDGSTIHQGVSIYVPDYIEVLELIYYDLGPDLSAIISEAIKLNSSMLFDCKLYFNEFVPSSFYYQKILG